MSEPSIAANAVVPVVPGVDGVDRVDGVDVPRAVIAPVPDAGHGFAPHRERLELLNNVEMEVTAELGRTRMAVRDLLSLTPGTVVELDRIAGSPIDLLVNGTLIARGEVVVIDEEFGIRISEIVGPGAGEAG